MSVEPAADPYCKKNPMLTYISLKLSIKRESDLLKTGHTVPLLWISYLEAPIAILALCAPAIGQLMTRARENHAFASFLSIFSSSRRSRKSGGSGSAEGETKAAYYYHNSSGSPTSGGHHGWSPHNPQTHHY